jgi:hypothetical protein
MLPLRQVGENSSFGFENQAPPPDLFCQFYGIVKAPSETRLNGERYNSMRIQQILSCTPAMYHASERIGLTLPFPLRLADVQRSSEQEEAVTEDL